MAAMFIASFRKRSLKLFLSPDHLVKPHESASLPPSPNTLGAEVMHMKKETQKPNGLQGCHGRSKRNNKQSGGDCPKRQRESSTTAYELKDIAKEKAHGVKEKTEEITDSVASNASETMQSVGGEGKANGSGSQGCRKR